MSPTPTHQDFLRSHLPEGLQPVDEDVDLKQIMALGEDVSARVLFYREVGVWHYGDYFHAVLGRCERLPNVVLRQARHEGLASVKHMVKQLLGRAAATATGRRDYRESIFSIPIPAVPRGCFRSPSRSDGASRRLGRIEQALSPERFGARTPASAQIGKRQVCAGFSRRSALSPTRAISIS